MGLWRAIRPAGAVAEVRATPVRPLRIAICAEVLSNNLGDGVIAESLAYLLRRHEPGAEVSLLDLNDRPGAYGSTGARARRQPWPRRLIWLRHLPGLFGLNPSRRWWRQLRELARSILAWISPWDPPLAPYDLVVFGGGQLLMDNDLWFPSRLWLQRRRLGPHSRSLAIHACGVGRQWSPLGRWLVKQLLADRHLVACTVRDSQSRSWALEHLDCGGLELEVVPDPALWAAEAFDVGRKNSNTPLGVGIMMPPLPGQGGDPDAAGWLSETFLLSFWPELIERSVAFGRNVRMFTNGAPEDQAFAEGIYASLSAPLQECTELLPRPRQPSELVELIAGCGCLVAQRLHALIISCSLGVPAVGLVWDDKVRQFGIMAGCPERMLEGASATPERALLLLEQAMAGSASDGTRVRLQREAAAGVAALLHRLPRRGETLT